MFQCSKLDNLSLDMSVLQQCSLLCYECLSDCDIGLLFRHAGTTWGVVVMMMVVGGGGALADQWALAAY